MNTPEGEASTGRSYGQACPVAHALDLVGERWALLVVRELRLGPRRYVDLQAALPGLGPSVLSQRLRDLERVGVLERRTLPGPGGARVYALTGWGGELEPVFTALARWGARSPVVPLRGGLSDDTVMLGLRTFFDRGDLEPWTASYRIDLDRETYLLRVARGRLVELVRTAEPGPVDATLATTPQTLQALLLGRLTPAAARRQITVTGDRSAARNLLRAAARR